MSKSKKRNVVVEAPLPNGLVSMVVGTMEKRTNKSIFLSHATFVAHTGRRSEFFAGRFDAQVELEPYPDTLLVEVPAQGAFVYDWPYELPRAAR